MLRGILYCILGLTLALGTAAAQIRVEALSPNELQVRKWNDFVDKLYALHGQQVSGREINEESRVGGYHRYPEFFEEVSYIDKATDRMVSKIQWERDTDPRLLQRIVSLWSDTPAPRERERLHSIEVYIYDEQGRVTRDYSATYLPTHRNAPIQTLVALHGYIDDLHAFRSFDASGNLLYEVCRGTHGGEKVDISMDEDAMITAREAPDSAMKTPTYLACFSNVPETPGDYHESPR